MHKALLLKFPDSVIPSETTVYRVMTAIGITHRPNRKPNGITNELFYSHGRRSTDYTTEQLKIIIWRCYMSCWNNRRICSPIALLLIIFE